MRKLITEISEEPASERLLRASATTEMEENRIPTVSFPADSKRFRKIPSHPESIPYLRRRSGSFIFLFFPNKTESRFFIKQEVSKKFRCPLYYSTFVPKIHLFSLNNIIVKKISFCIDKLQRV